MGAHNGHPIPAWVCTATSTTSEISCNQSVYRSNLLSSCWNLWFLCVWYPCATDLTTSGNESESRSTRISAYYSMYPRAFRRSRICGSSSAATSLNSSCSNSASSILPQLRESSDYPSFSNRLRNSSSRAKTASRSSNTRPPR